MIKLNANIKPALTGQTTGCCSTCSTHFQLIPAVRGEAVWRKP